MGLLISEGTQLLIESLHYAVGVVSIFHLIRVDSQNFIICSGNSFDLFHELWCAIELDLNESSKTVLLTVIGS